MTKSNSRESEYPIDPLFLDRWSPRAFTGEAIGEDTLLTILDAAHWAPSSGNGQPWRFVYALRDTPSWPVLFGILNESNQRWVKNASALIILISKTYRISSTGERRHAHTHAFDTGAAWFSLAVQTMKLGLYAHGMEGMSREKAMEVLGVPEGYRVEAAVAIGRLADRDTLPEDIRKNEVPSKRRPLSEVAFEGSFKGQPD